VASAGAAGQLDAIRAKNFSGELHRLKAAAAFAGGFFGRTGCFVFHIFNREILKIRENKMDFPFRVFRVVRGQPTLPKFSAIAMALRMAMDLLIVS
jgi:hypothetical protein